MFLAARYTLALTITKSNGKPVRKTIEVDADIEDGSVRQMLRQIRRDASIYICEAILPTLNRQSVIGEVIAPRIEREDGTYFAI
jgi:hypothetical protein